MQTWQEHVKLFKGSNPKIRLESENMWLRVVLQCYTIRHFFLFSSLFLKTKRQQPANQRGSVLAFVAMLNMNRYNV